MPAIIPNLWFDDNGLEAAEFYVSLFPNSKIVNVFHYGENAPKPAGEVMVVDFELDGQPHSIINGGPQFHFDEAISLLVDCKDQDEIDHYWAALSAVPDAEACGWCKDRFGVSWQVVPAGLDLLQQRPEQIQALMHMKKILIAELEIA